MVVECPSCKTRYNLSPALFDGSRGARVRCRRCGDRFEVRNPENPPPTDAVEPPRLEMKPAIEPVPPKPSEAPAVALNTPEAGDNLSSPQNQSREKIFHRSRRSEQTLPGGKAAYYLAGSIVIVLGIAVALWAHPEFRWGLPSVPEKTSQDVRIISSHYARSSWGKQLYVLRGSVRDTRGGAASSPIRLRARIFNAKKGVLAEKTFLAGSDIPEIGIPPEIKLDNTILEDGWLPFIVIFYDPGVIADVSVTIEPM